MIKLIALDMDGTIFSEDLLMAPAVREAIGAAQRAGVKVTLASGRMVRSIRPIATDLGIDVPIISYQGAVVYDLRAGQFLMHYRLDRTLALAIIDYIHSQNLYCNAYIDDNLYVAAMNAATEFYASLSTGVPINPVGDLHAFVEQAENTPTKLSVVLASEPDADHMVATLREMFGAALYAVKPYPIFAECVNPAANKGVALAHLAAHLGIDQSETMAIGDGQNDIPMLHWAGIGVAMGQARQNVKDSADFVTTPLREDGVARAIERFVL